jgi:hypothetical protein
MNQYPKERVVSSKFYGKVSVHETGEGIANLRVKAIDRDIVFDDLLGAVLTDERGCFIIEYNEQDFQEMFFDKMPDIYIEVINQDGELIHSTEPRTRYGAGSLEMFDIKIPARLLRRRSSTQSFAVKPDGGTLDHPDGLSIQVPPDAFDTECGRPLHPGAARRVRH